MPACSNRRSERTHDDRDVARRILPFVEIHPSTMWLSAHRPSAKPPFTKWHGQHGSRLWTWRTHFAEAAGISARRAAPARRAPSREAGLYCVRNAMSGDTFVARSAGT